jgi:hypothetical protein
LSGAGSEQQSHANSRRHNSTPSQGLTPQATAKVATLPAAAPAGVASIPVPAPTSRGVSGAASKPAASLKPPEEEELAWVQETQTRNPNHREHVLGPNASILKKPKLLRQSRTQKRKVAWRTSFNERIFDKETASVHWLVHAPQSTSGANIQSPRPVVPRQASPEEAEAISLKAIVKAVRSNNMDDLITELQTGLVGTEAELDGEKWLSREYKFVKKRKMEDMETVLKIYRTARTELAFAQSLRFWSRYVVRVEKISGLVLSPRGIHQQGANAAFEAVVVYNVGGASQILASVPIRNVSGSGIIDYQEDTAVETEFPIHYIHYNRGVPEDRAVEVKLKSTVDRSELASVYLPIDEVSQKCYAMDRPVAFERECRIGGDFEPGVKILLSAKKISLERDYLGEFYCCQQYHSLVRKPH